MKQLSEKMKEAYKLLPLFGIEKLKDFQKKCISEIIDNKDVFCVQNTGSGKSVCYQIPALVLDGTTVVVSPLIALINDQVTALKDILKDENISVEAFYGGMDEKEYERIKTELKSRECNIKLLYTTPETLWVNRGVFNGIEIPLLVIDEAHCIYTWGYGFRPAYRCIGYFANHFPPEKRPVIAAFTATVDKRIFKDIVKNLGMSGIKKPIGYIPEKLDFPENAPKRKIFLYRSQKQQIYNICKFLSDDKNKGKKCLVFCRSKIQLKLICEMLGTDISKIKSSNADTAIYYGSEGDKRKSEEMRDFAFLFADGKVKRMIATSAFGMGIDIGDIECVIHAGFPYTMTDYIQQCGRGGRGDTDCEYRMYASVSDIENTEVMLALRNMKMYPLDKCVSIKNRNRDDYIEVVEYCLNSADSVSRSNVSYFKTALEAFRSIKFPEEYYLENKQFQMLINTSYKVRSMIRRKELSFLESVLADGIYSLRYNGAVSFTERALMVAVTGNEKLSFHKEKCESTRKIIDELIRKRLVPVEKRMVNEKAKYYFNDYALNGFPGAFPLHESAISENRLSNIPDGILRVLTDKSDSDTRKKKRDDYKEVIAIKYYLIHELNRIFNYSDIHDIYSVRKNYDSEFLRTNDNDSGEYMPYSKISTKTARRIIYTRYDRNARSVFKDKTSAEEKTAGIFNFIDFPYSVERLHIILCEMLDNLKKNGYLRNYRILYYTKEQLKKARKMKWDLCNETPKGIPMGIEFFVK